MLALYHKTTVLGKVNFKQYYNINYVTYVVTFMESNVTFPHLAEARSLFFCKYLTPYCTQQQPI